MQRKFQKLLNDHFNNLTRVGDMRELVAATDVMDQRHYNDFLQEFGSFNMMNFMEELDRRVTTLERGRKVRRITPTPAPTSTEEKKTQAMVAPDKEKAGPAPCPRCEEMGEYRSDTYDNATGNYIHTNYRCQSCKNSYTKVIQERKDRKGLGF
jgi:hypothetical protein